MQCNNLNSGLISNFIILEMGHFFAHLLIFYSILYILYVKSLDLGFFFMRLLRYVL